MIDYKMGYSFNVTFEIIEDKLAKAIKNHSDAQMEDLLGYNTKKDHFVWHDPWVHINQGG